MLMNALQKHTIAALMVCAIIPRDHTTAFVYLDSLEMEDTAKVDRFQMKLISITARNKSGSA